MPTVMGHVAPAIALIPAFHTPEVPGQLWLLGMGLALLPDLDAIGIYAGIPYFHPLGHRGLTHSIPFAFAISGLTVLLAFPEGLVKFSRLKAWAYLFISIGSHGVLDVLTDGGLGVAFWSPFLTDRYFLPLRPIRVSPLDPWGLFSEYGLLVFTNELTWIWAPATTIAGLTLAAKGFRKQRSWARHK